MKTNKIKTSFITNKSIAVLPFVNMSANGEIEYFSDGITEEIINALAKIEQLKVTSRTSSFYYKNKNIPIQQIANELNVNTLLEGSVRVSSNTVRITAQLIHAEKDFHFWSESWDRKLENIFEIQDEISLLIAEKLREFYGHFEIREHLVPKSTNSFSVYELSLKAKYHFNKWNPEDVKIAIDYFEKALRQDAKHIDSWVGLADAYGFMASTELIPPIEGWQKVRDYTNKAFEINPEHASVHYQLANLAFFQDANFKEAANHTLKSIELKPNYPEAHQFISFLFMISGNMEKAKHHLEIALNIDPLSQETLFYKAYYYYRKEEYYTALDLFEQCLKNNPKNVPALTVMNYCMLKLERYDDVLKNMEEMPKELIVPDEKLGITCLAYILKKDDSEIQKYLSCLQLEAKSSSAFQSHSYLYLAYANMGKLNDAFQWLDKIIQLKSPIILLSFADPLANPIKGDKRYMNYQKELFQISHKTKIEISGNSSLLDDKTASQYTKSLLSYLNEEEPYLIPNLSLRTLADQVQIHPNKLSWLLNERIGKNFNEFINHYRIEYFKKLALDPKNSHISLIGLAYESGFNSKTVFNTYFKKETGLTPKAYLKQNSSEL